MAAGSALVSHCVGVVAAGDLSYLGPDGELQMARMPVTVCMTPKSKASPEVLAVRKEVHSYHASVSADHK